MSAVETHQHGFPITGMELVRLEPQLVNDFEVEENDTEVKVKNGEI